MLREFFFIGFIIGIFARSFIDLGISFAFLFAFCGALLFFAEYFYKNYFGQELRLKSIAFILIFFAFGIGWYELRAGDNQKLSALSLGAQSLKVFVSEEPEEKNGKLNAAVVYDGEEKIFIKSSLLPAYKYGDILQIFGDLKKPENFSEGFDYVSYLEKDDIYFLMDDARVKVLETGGGSRLKKILFAVRDTFTQGLRETLPEPHSSLAAGLLLGAKDSLGKEWLEKFRTAGLSHIVVLSGYNLTIIADSVMKVVSRFSAGIVPSAFGAISVMLFTIMTGAGASTVRAAIMALIILLAKTTGRVYEASSALIVAGVLMIIHNPRVLVFDMSFQLSFLATLGILYVSPLIKERLKFVTEKLGLREMLSSTIGAQIATSPLIIYKMGTFSLVALPANILVVFLIPATMFFGFLAALTGFVSYYLAIPFSAVAWLLLSYILSVVNFFSSLPFAAIDVNALSILFILVVIFVAVLACKKRGTVRPEIDQWKIEEIK